MKRIVLTGIVCLLLTAGAFAQETVIKDLAGNVEVKSSADSPWANVYTHL